MYGSGSGSFYHQAKIPSVLWLFGTFFFENDVNVPSKSNKQKKLYFWIGFGLAS
jgi:hypothetical protein